jgi:hypothetical protein
MAHLGAVEAHPEFLGRLARFKLIFLSKCSEVLPNSSILRSNHAIFLSES